MNTTFPMFRKCILALLAAITLLSSPLRLSAQKEFANWYFGFGAGVSFNSGSPVSLAPVNYYAKEGCATVSDKDGKLLFYTNGLTIYARNHSPMTNGLGLKGGRYATNPAVVVQQPGNADRYYVFTIEDRFDYAGSPDEGGEAFCYSIVDMSKGANGEVVEKNRLIKAGPQEAMVAIRHENGDDVWIVATNPVAGSFQAFLLTATGLHTQPVETQTNSFTLDDRFERGTLTASEDGTQIACSQNSREIDLYKFDAATGKLSNRISLPRESYQIGLAFSPNGRFLYVSVEVDETKVYQLEVSQWNRNAILASKYQLISYPPALDDDRFARMQLAIDKKIYFICLPNRLGVVPRPNEKAPACGIDTSAIHLQAMPIYGLPAPVMGAYVPQFEIVEDACDPDSTRLDLVGGTPETIRWTFGDGESKTVPGKKKTIYHKYPSGGYYLVKAVCRYKGVDYIAQKRIRVTYLKRHFLGRDTILCTGDTLELRPKANPWFRYKWNTGDTGKSITISQGGTYWLTLEDSGCMLTDTLHVISPDQLAEILGPDTFVCEGSTLTLSAPKITNVTYTWSTGSHSNAIQVLGPGTYWLKMQTVCGEGTDTVVVEARPVPKAILPSKVYLCRGEQLTLRAGSWKGSHYLWQDSTTDSILVVNTPGTYFVRIKSACGEITDTTVVEELQAPIFHLGNDTIICLQDSIRLQVTSCLTCTFQWQDGSTPSMKWAKNQGTYRLTARNACGSFSDSIRIEKEDCTCYLYMPDAFTPNGDLTNENIKPSVCRTTEYEFAIYNRWGQRIFSTSDIAAGWNGIYQGTEAPEGTYLYTIYTRGVDKQVYYKSGKFHLLR